jgi:phosphinothricin acetyltransferase
MTDDHWDRVAKIYQQGIATRNATFDIEVPSKHEWDASHLKDHRIVAVQGDVVLGWIAVSPISDRCAYRGVVENSVYIAEEARGRGIGLELLRAVAGSTESAGIWTI